MVLAHVANKLSHLVAILTVIWYTSCLIYFMLFQMVLAHVANKLSHLVSILTVQVIKDDWTRLAPLSSFSNISTTQLPPPAPLSSSIMSAMPNSNTFTPPSSPPNTQKALPKTNFDYLKTPARASSTPYGTPMKDLSFGANLDPIVPQFDQFTGAGRTNYNSAPMMGLQRTEMLPPPVQTGAGLKSTGVISVNNFGTAGAGFKSSGVISVNNLGTSNLYPMGKSLSNQRPSSLRW